MAKKQTVADKYFSKPPDSSKLIRGLPRKLFIRHKPTGALIRSRGYTFEHALHVQGWRESDVIATDLGPSGPDRFITEYVKPSPPDGREPSGGGEPGKE